MTALMPSVDRPMPLREAFDRLFQTMLTPVFDDGEAGLASIPTNVWETADGYQVVMLLPGVDPKGVDISAVGNTITVSGEMRVKEPEAGRFVWQEFGASRFRRQIGLPTDFDSGKVKAEYRNGLLLLTIPKAEQSKARRIAVKAAS
jgi:HSP20 family protein